ncbi:hypothetical protein D1871_11735 [Nakamurella silvestris]|nr:hypothetical protein D1871_11735 [Nakamurella silvestris]
MHSVFARPKHVRRWSVAACVIGLIVSGCSTASTTDRPAPPTTAPVGGTTTDPGTTAGRPSTPAALTISTGFAIDDLDPLENGFWGNEFGYAELLMKPTLSGVPTPWLLSSLTNTDATVWVLTLKDGITFQNGSALDAAALAAVMDYQLTENPSLASTLAGATVEATGPDQVTLTTAKATPNMPNILAAEGMFTIYDQAAYLKAKGDPKALITAKIYTGPYVVESLSPEKAELAPNPTYWAGEPGLSDLSILFVPDAQARILAVQNGEADLALYPPTAAAVTFQGRDDSFYLTGTPTGPTFQLVPNTKDPVIADAAVRRALYLAVDYTELATDVMDGLYEPATGLYSPRVPWAVETQHTDLAAAGQELDGAGWKLGSDGIREKDGKKLALQTLTYPQQPDSDTLALAVQAQFKKVGIDLSIRQVPDIEAEMTDSSDWQLAIAGNGFVSFGGDPITPLQNYLRSGGSRNFAKVADPELDSLIDTIAVTVDDEARYAHLRDLQKYVADKAYLGYLGMRLPNVVVGERMKDFQVPTALLWVTAETVVTN